MKMLQLIGAMALGVSVALTQQAVAGFLGPGESVVVQREDFEPATGTLLAETSRVLTLVYDPSPQSFPPPLPSVLLLDVKVTSRVLRDAATGFLTFEYSATPLEETSLDSETSLLRVSSFAGWQTDVSGLLLLGGEAAIARSGDGSSVTIDEATAGLAGSPLLVVRTNARHFDDRGSGFLRMSDDFFLLEPGNGGTDFFGIVAGQSSFLGTHQPIIPLPAAVWAGMGTLALVGLMRKRLLRVGG